MWIIVYRIRKQMHTYKEEETWNSSSTFGKSGLRKRSMYYEMKKNMVNVDSREIGESLV